MEPAEKKTTKYFDNNIFQILLFSIQEVLNITFILSTQLTICTSNMKIESNFDSNINGINGR